MEARCAQPPRARGGPAPRASRLPQLYSTPLLSPGEPPARPRLPALNHHQNEPEVVQKKRSSGRGGGDDPVFDVSAGIVPGAVIAPMTCLCMLAGSLFAPFHPRQLRQKTPPGHKQQRGNGTCERVVERGRERGGGRRELVRAWSDFHKTVACSLNWSAPVVERYC